MTTEGRSGSSAPTAGVLAVGPFPPFMGGAAKNTEIICSTLEEHGARVVRLSTNKTRSRAEHSRSFGSVAERALGFLTNIRKIMTERSKGSLTTVYLVPDGGMGVAFSAAYARLAAPMFPRLVVHHRSYNHLRRRSRLMAVLMRTAPRKALHVFLDPVMEQQFKAAYADNVASMYVPNAATCDIVPDTAFAGSTAPKLVTVGFLSNLVEEKGFDVVAEAFLRLSEKLGPHSRFLLAGRPVGARNEERLKALRQSLGDRLVYLGEVSGQAKSDFFKACDIFLFPTRFAQEAQPNVLYEAMAGGAAIVSTRWAGIPWVLEGTVSRMVEADDDGCDDLVDAVMDIVESGQLLHAPARQVRAFFDKKADADARYSQLIAVLLGSGVR